MEPNFSESEAQDLAQDHALPRPKRFSRPPPRIVFCVFLPWLGGVVFWRKFHKNMHFCTQATVANKNRLLGLWKVEQFWIWRALGIKLDLGGWSRVLYFGPMLLETLVIVPWSLAMRSL